MTAERAPGGHAQGGVATHARKRADPSRLLQEECGSWPPRQYVTRAVVACRPPQCLLLHAAAPQLHALHVWHGQPARPLLLPTWTPKRVQGRANPPNSWVVRPCDSRNTQFASHKPMYENKYEKHVWMLCGSSVSPCWLHRVQHCIQCDIQTTYPQLRTARMQNRLVAVVLLLQYNISSTKVQDG